MAQIPEADRAEIKRKVDDIDRRLVQERSEVQVAEKARGMATSAAGGKGMAYGMRMASELVAAVIIGALIGYGLDYLCASWFGVRTFPALTLVFFMLGFAAGIMNVLRGYRRIEAEMKAETGGSIGKSVADDED